LVQARSNVFQRLDCYRDEWRWRFVQILSALLQDRWNILDPRENFPAARSVVRSWHNERFDYRRERLLDIKIGIAFPAWIDV
jgi:hypothetical protein